MKIWEVSWSTPKEHMLMSSSYNLSTNNKKAFATREKAEELYKKIYDAASLLQIGIQCYINEVELE